MIKPTVSLLEVVEFLNLLVVLDRDAMQKMFGREVVVDDKIALNTAAKCGRKSQKYTMTPLGMLNGIFAKSNVAHNPGGIMAYYDVIQVGLWSKQVLRGFTLTSEGKEALKKSAGIGRRDARIN